MTQEKLRSSRLPLLAIALVSCVLYLNTLPGELVWDDLELLPNQPLIREPGSLFAIFGSPYWGPGDYLYRPLTLWSLALNHGASSASGFAGEHPWGYHAFNLLLHAAVGCALFGFLRRLSLDVWPSLVAALLFAAHPIHTEVVAQIVGRSELLAALFGLLFLIFHLRRRSVVAAAGCFLLALVSKESAIAFFPLALWTDVCFPRAHRWWWRGYGAYALAVLGWLGLRAAALRTSTEGLPFIDNPLAYTSVMERIWTAGWVQLRYLGLEWVPLGLSADYSYNQIPPVTNVLDLRFLGFVAVLLGAGAAAWLLRDRHRIVAYGIVGYVVLFSLTANFLFPIGTIMGERLAYAPSIFAILLPVYGAWLLNKRFGRTVTGLVAVVLLLFCGLTVARNRTWNHPDVFARTLVRTAPDSAKAHYTLCVTLYGEDSFEQASESCRRAISIHPRYAEAWNRLGSVHDRTGDYTSAVEAYATAASIFPGFVDAHYGLGHAHHMLDQLDLAAASYRTALRLDPQLVLAYANLGAVYARQGRLEEAERLWHEALELDPDHESSRKNLEQLRRLDR